LSLKGPWFSYLGMPPVGLLHLLTRLHHLELCNPGDASALGYLCARLLPLPPRLRSLRIRGSRSGNTTDEDLDGYAAVKAAAAQQDCVFI
jgi:hypothetical protein